MKLQLKNAAPASEIQLSDVAFGRAYNEALVHQVVTAYMAAGRSGTSASACGVASITTGSRNALSDAIKCERSTASFHSSRK